MTRIPTIAALTAFTVTLGLVGSPRPAHADLPGPELEPSEGVPSSGSDGQGGAGHHAISNSKWNGIPC